jgi:hypothetical protein
MSISSHVSKLNIELACATKESFSMFPCLPILKEPTCFSFFLFICQWRLHLDRLAAHSILLSFQAMLFWNLTFLIWGNIFQIYSSSLYLLCLGLFSINKYLASELLCHVKLSCNFVNFLHK